VLAGGLNPDTYWDRSCSAKRLARKKINEASYKRTKAAKEGFKAAYQRRL
jgi:hypothetical protein